MTQQAHSSHTCPEISLQAIQGQQQRRKQQQPLRQQQQLETSRATMGSVMKRLMEAAGLIGQAGEEAANAMAAMVFPPHGGTSGLGFGGYLVTWMLVAYFVSGPCWCT